MDAKEIYGEAAALKDISDREQIYGRGIASYFINCIVGKDD